MKRPALLIYGLTCYALFNLSFVYLAGFLLNIGVPKAINDGVAAPVGVAVAVNLGLVFLFGFFHSLMARETFKAKWTKIIPPAAERSTYVLQSAAFLGLAMWQWKPIDTVLWHVDGIWAVAAYAAFGLGLGLVLVSTFLIDHFELFGLSQVWRAQSGQSPDKPVFRTPFLYKFVRHPMQLGVIVLVFSTPVMTVGHAVFAVSMSVYVLIGLWFEERALLREFGDTYRTYQTRVPMLIPNAPWAYSANTRLAAEKPLNVTSGIDAHAEGSDRP